MERTTVESAKQFLLSKLEEQALHDSVQLSDIEKSMFLFAETSASEEMLAAAQEFDATCDESKYENKISKLLRRAYRHDQKQPDGNTSWRQSLDALKNEDFYGMVMLDQAGLPVSTTGVLRALLEMWPLVAIPLAIGVPGFLIVLDPFGWGLIRSDWIRLSLLPVFVFAIWWAVGKYSESTFPKSRKSS